MSYNEESTDTINTGVAIAASVAGIFIGFLMGWFANDTSQARTVCIFISILLIIACKYGVRGCANLLVGHSELVRQHRYDDQALAEQQTKAALLQVKAAKEVMKSEIKYSFTSEDFNETAQAMLKKMVKNAKRSDVKVTGENLVTSVLKGIR